MPFFVIEMPFLKLCPPTLKQVPASLPDAPEYRVQTVRTPMYPDGFSWYRSGWATVGVYHICIPVSQWVSVHPFIQVHE